jgi:ectoine hydroxylase-related dioxygenase (phytanoyl-CoA dioxygenase family)
MTGKYHMFLAKESIPFLAILGHRYLMITSTPELITAEQIRHYREHGYCVVPRLFTEAEIVDIEAFFEDFKKNGDKVYDGGLGYDEVDPTKAQVRAMHPHRYSKRVQEWFLNPNVASVLETLLGRPALGAQTMYYFKPPGAKGQGMHQDDMYLLTAPATCIAAWTAIDDATVENGCLYVSPGSQKRGIFCPDKNMSDMWMNYGDSHITPFPRDLKPIPVEVPRGSTMFFGGHLIHGSGPNRSKTKWRRTFIGHYIDNASEQVAKFYHPVLNMQGEVVSQIKLPEGGGPCGDGWQGAVH